MGDSYKESHLAGEEAQHGCRKDPYNYFDRDAYRGGLYAIHQDKANISFSDGHVDSAAYHQGPDFNLSFIDKNLNIYSEYGRWEQQITRK